MRYLLDTNVFREVGKEKPHINVARWLASVDDHDLTISALTVREVAKGVARLRASKPDVAEAIGRRVERVFEAFSGRILPVDHDVADAWGKLLAGSDKHLDDAGIAATALVHKLTVVTRNIGHFEGRGAALLDPYRWRHRDRGRD